MTTDIKLSRQELNLLELFKRDKSYKEAARDMNISPNTVPSICRRLYFKLNAKDKLDAVLIGLRTGLISLSLIFSIVAGLADGDADHMIRTTRMTPRETRA